MKMGTIELINTYKAQCPHCEATFVSDDKSKVLSWLAFHFSKFLCTKRMSEDKTFYIDNIRYGKDTEYERIFKKRKFKITEPKLILGENNPYLFIKHFKLDEEFKKEFEAELDDYLDEDDYCEGDQDIYQRMFKYIDTKDTYHFVIWNETEEEFYLYNIVITIHEE